MRKFFILFLFIVTLSFILFNFFTRNSVKKMIKNFNGSQIKIFKPVPLSYKTKKEVYDIRKKYVNMSIFAQSNYEPSEDVFGKIEDGKPWISTNRCKNADGSTRINGTSEESLSINNPSILVDIDTFFYDFPNGDDSHPVCNYIILPSYVWYDDVKREEIVIYQNFNTKNKSNTHLLKALNARDLGYKYAYIDKFNSSNPVRFKEKKNISNEVYEFKDFIHVGGACKVEGGCNNGSPYQPELEFYFPKRNQNIVLHIKFWKEKPKSKYHPADFTEKLVILKRNDNSKNKK